MRRGWRVCQSSGHRDRSMADRRLAGPSFPHVGQRAGSGSGRVSCWLSMSPVCQRPEAPISTVILVARTRKMKRLVDLPSGEWAWAEFARELLLELKLKCEDPMHLEHLALVDEFMRLND